MALLLKTDGTVQKIDLPVTSEDRITFLQQLVGGCLAVIDRYDNKIYLGHQEGRARSLPMNPFLSFPFFGDLICVQTPEELCEAEHFIL